MINFLISPNRFHRTIYKASLQRQIKAGMLDRENFGEVIAAQIGRKLLDEQLVPDVFPVYGTSKEGVYVASKYLGSKKNLALTLDKFSKKIHEATLIGKHIQVVVKKPRPDKGEVSFYYAPQLKQDLCKAIVLSAVLGDHDVNPGNMMVFKIDNKPRIARIDFGHAFNDLLKCSRINGGKIRDKENPILDFFNRTEVGGVLGAPSKLWRDYPDLIPCKEMADALRAISENFDTKFKDGV